MLFRKIHAIDNYERELSRKKNCFDDILLTAHFLFVKPGERHATKTTLINKAKFKQLILINNVAYQTNVTPYIPEIPK